MEDEKELIEGILFRHIQNNPIVGAVMTKVVHENLTEEEGLRLMVNMLADENARLKQMNIELKNRVPIRDLAKNDGRGIDMSVDIESIEENRIFDILLNVRVGDITAFEGKEAIMDYLKSIAKEKEC